MRTTFKCSLTAGFDSRSMRTGSKLSSTYNQTSYAPSQVHCSWLVTCSSHSILQCLNLLICSAVDRRDDSSGDQFQNLWKNRLRNYWGTNCNEETRSCMSLSNDHHKTQNIAELQRAQLHSQFFGLSNREILRSSVSCD